MTPPERTLAYHQRTKHHLRRYARSLGRLDWATQPDPFRTFAGAETVELPLLADGLEVLYSDLERPGVVAPRPLAFDAMAIFFELSLGLSAWKRHEDARWALRCNPSSGNLHPTEGYAVVPDVPGLSAGVYHYVSRDHALERRCAPDGDGARALAARLSPAFLVGLTSIHWREAWKYGERAFRYCQHDAGHAIAALRYAAAAIGWSATMVDGLGDADIAALLGLDRADDFADVDPADREHPDAVLVVCPDGTDGRAAASALSRAAPEILGAVRAGRWSGRANALSTSHVPWEVIDDVAEATQKPTTPPSDVVALSPQHSLPPLSSGGVDRGMRAATLIRQRRSALDYDGATSIDAAVFYSMLDRLLPRPGVPPWDALPWEPLVHAGIFVHRVRGLEPGLYLFERSDAAHERLRAAMQPAFLWQKPAGCPDHLRFHLLMDADLREVSRIVSCHQAIASDGVFSLGMIADFAEPARERGAFWYRRLFWEAGVLGHVLYLEAEALNRPDAPLRATGIGCYFDDVFHDLFELTGDDFQSLYHFTVGGHVEDTRITTLPPYAHLGGRGRAGAGAGSRGFG